MSKVKLGDVARECKSTVKDSSGLPNVGLEHLIPGQIELTQSVIFFGFSYSL